MLKKLFVLFVIMVSVKAQQNIVDNFSDYYNYTLRSDDYVNMNRRQYDNIINEYDLQMENLKTNFGDRLSTINIQLEMLVYSLKLNDEHLNPLEILSYYNKQCISKYRSKIPTIAATKSTIQACITTASSQLNALIAAPLTTRNNLYNYYKNNFEKGITECDKKHGNMKLNHTVCVTNLVTTTTTTTTVNQKAFLIQMDAAQSTANAHVKKALDCSFSCQNRTISLIAEANSLINRCTENLNNTDDGSKEFSCSNIYFMRQSQVDYHNHTMINPFYGRNETSICLLLKLY